jgi:phthiocerol/phenolphthiocerol synthesis type-I polyketide synthase A
MTAPLSEDALRHWLVDYLITHTGCDVAEINLDCSFADLGVGSRDAVVLSGELAELLGRPVSPLEFWQHPTINSLIRHLTTPQAEVEADTADTADRSRLDEPIAVIGLACRLPGDIDGPESLWQFLSEGRSSVGEVPPDRWAPFDSGSPEAAAALSGTTRWGSFLPEIDAFDAEFFEISPREAVSMDPQQRLLLELTSEALEHAGIPADSLRRTQTGVFAGACASEYGYLASNDLSRVDALSGTGGALSIIANRVSYFYDLRGPSVTVDTACSSSLVALHLACQSLRTGDSDLAIAAGVNLLLSPVVTRSFDQAEVMSPTGRCHAFDADADGLVRGEGCGVVVLKALSDALRDGDRVLAVVRGSAVNQDGRSNGLMAPNPAAQMAVLRAAYANAGIPPHEVDYVEAHGSGTLISDPIEARALGTVLGRGRPADGPLLIGALKSNMGSLEGAGGVASFIKAVLSVQRGHIPANLHFEKPNPHIPFDDLRLKVVATPTDWPATGRPRRVGVSSFGFGGTNAHVVLEQAPEPWPVARQPEPALSTLVVSGKSAARIASTAGALAQWMDGAGAAADLADVAHTLNHHRSRHPKFATVAAVDRDQAVAALRALAEGQAAPGLVHPHDGPCSSGTVFVFSDEGSQWPGMGRQLLADEPAFAAAIAALEPDFVEQNGFSLKQVLTEGEELVGADRIQPVLVAMQLALAALWRAHGVRPDAVIGHSMGEISAAVVAGALTPAEGLRVVATRSRLMALHHPAIDAVLPELSTALADLAPRSPKIPVITSTGAAPVYDADYWAVKLPDPGLFSEAVLAAGADHATFVEVSPHPLLSSAISDTLAEVHHHSIGTLARDVHDTLAFHTNLNATHTKQAPETDHPSEPHPVIPTTPWHHTHHWMSPPASLRRNGMPVAGTSGALADDKAEEPATAAREPAPHLVTIRERLQAAVSSPRSGTLLGEHIGIPTTPPVHLWQAWLRPDNKPYPGSHLIRGVDVVPVSVLLETLSTAAAQCQATALSDVRFEYPVVVNQPRVIQVVADGESVTVASASTSDAPAHQWISHVVGRISREPKEAGHKSVSADHTPPSRDVSWVHDLVRAWGMDGFPFVWSIDSWWSAPDRLHADVSLPQASTVALVDAAVHIGRLVEFSDQRLMLPAAAQRVSFEPGLTASQYAVEVYRRGGSGDELTVDVVVTAPDGTTVLSFGALRYVAVVSELAQQAAQEEPATLAWSTMSEESIVSELQIRLRAILARELGMPASAVDMDRPLPELGFNSMMAMTLLREAKVLLGFELSATMLWDHPTVSSLSAYLAEILAPQQVLNEGFDEPTTDSESSLLDALFDSVESATAGSESGI